MQRRDDTAHEKHGDQGDDRRQPPVAGGEIVGQDRDQALTGRVDDPAADDAGGITAEAHADRQRLLPAGMRLLKMMIQVEGDTRKVSKIF